jgi:hypothetical protein
MFDYNLKQSNYSIEVLLKVGAEGSVQLTSLY